MKQIILMSIRPEWVAKILNGEKTVEIRKTALHEGDEVHIYCTKNGFPLVASYSGVEENEKPTYTDMRFLPPVCSYPINGKVVAKFIVGKVEKYEIEWFPLGNDRECYQVLDRIDTFDDEEDLYTIISNEQPSFDFNTEYIKGSCLSFDELGKYATNNKGGIGRFATLEITHLEIFDKPRELWEYFKAREITMSMTKGGHQKLTMYDKITHAPQSWQYAWVEE